MALTADELPDKSLLIVDDDAPFRQRLARAMEARGFIVTAAETAEEAMAHARKSPPALKTPKPPCSRCGKRLL